MNAYNPANPYVNESRVHLAINATAIKPNNKTKIITIKISIITVNKTDSRTVTDNINLTSSSQSCYMQVSSSLYINELKCNLEISVVFTFGTLYISKMKSQDFLREITESMESEGIDNVALDDSTIQSNISKY